MTYYPPPPGYSIEVTDKIPDPEQVLLPMDKCSYLFRKRTNEKRKFFYKFEEKRYQETKKDALKKGQTFTEKAPAEPRYLPENKGFKYPEQPIKDPNLCHTIFVSQNGSNTQPLTDVRQKVQGQSDTLSITPHWLRTRKGETIPSFLVTHKADNIHSMPSASDEIVEIIKSRKSSKLPRAPLAESSRRPLIIFSHGNSTDIGWMLESIRILAREWNVNFFTYEYSGYGLSSGKPSESNTFADIEAAYDFAVNVLEVDPRLIVLYGQSVGSGPTAYLAGTLAIGELGGAIFHSGIASGVRIFAPQIDNTPWFDLYPNVDHIKRSRTPVLVLHGRKDKEVPLLHGKMLASSAMENKNLFEFIQFEAGHNNIETGPTRRQFLFAVLKFLVRGVVERESNLIDLGTGSCHAWYAKMSPKLIAAENALAQAMALQKAKKATALNNQTEEGERKILLGGEGHNAPTIIGVTTTEHAAPSSSNVNEIGHKGSSDGSDIRAGVVGKPSTLSPDFLHVDENASSS